MFSFGRSRSGDGASSGRAKDDFAAARERLLTEIEYEMRETVGYTGRGHLSDRVHRAMGEVPRHEFVPEEDVQNAYVNRARGIGYGQTISQPYIVALMTELLDLEPSDRVLEIGTGCGYQAAVLSGLVAEVYSIEFVPELGTEAGERLRRLGYDNVEVRIGDGRLGWPEKAPFDGIIVTAVAEDVPQPLLDQLANGGRMMIPLGASYGAQDLVLVTKDENGEVSHKAVLPVAFVPLVKGASE